jgi:cytochrome c peroxidase
VAAAFTASGDLVVQTRQPASLYVASRNLTISLSSIDRSDMGHELFHANSGAHIACASCHPEGGDDGRTWKFDGEGDRRTPSLRGTIAGTAPYHWAGEMQDFQTLVHDVLTERMSGPALSSTELVGLTTWVNGIPAPVAPAPSDPAAAARGDDLFHGAAACSTCHSGPKLTNNMTVDVGTGEAFQVPPLIGLGYRAPFMHSGCAATLTDRFTCGGSMHGNTANLGSDQISDLIAYLSTL